MYSKLRSEISIGTCLGTFFLGVLDSDMVTDMNMDIDTDMGMDMDTDMDTLIYKIYLRGKCVWRNLLCPAGGGG
jgi:hypothetical protein